MSTTIPLVDLARWRDGDPSARAALAAEFDRALQKSGFLMIANHGISAALRTQIRDSARRFFTLPAEQKSAYRTGVGGRGWVARGREANSFYGETADVTRADLKESYTLGRTVSTGDDALDAEWFQPNRWPTETPELQDLCTRFADAVRGLYVELLEICATALGFDPDRFVRHTHLSPHTFNINRYPALAETGSAAEGQYRIAPHTDWGIITVLDRQPGYGGLQVQRLDGEWEDAAFGEDAFTVNIGDLMARWTGDRWRSTRHRVLPPPPEAPDEELISLIVFCEVDVDTVVEPLEPPIGYGADYPPVTAGQYLLERAAAATVA